MGPYYARKNESEFLVSFNADSISCSVSRIKNINPTKNKVGVIRRDEPFDSGEALKFDRTDGMRKITLTHSSLRLPIKVGGMGRLTQVNSSQVLTRVRISDYFTTG